MMNAKLLAAAMTAGFAFAANGAYAQSVDLRAPQIAQEETKSFLEFSSRALAQADNNEPSAGSQVGELMPGSDRRLVQGVIYEGYTLPGHRDDILWMARVEPTLALGEGERSMHDDAVAAGSDSGAPEGTSQ